MKKITLRKDIIVGLCLAVVIMMISFPVVVYIDKHQHEIVLSWRCMNKSFDGRYRVYSATVDENPGNFYRKKLANNKLVEMGEAAIPLIIEELFSGDCSFEKKCTLFNTIGCIHPKTYSDIFAGPPYSEVQIDSEVAKKIFFISRLEGTTIPYEQRCQILRRLESFGEEYKSKYEKYKILCEKQD
ncbi:MAG: hypothetical protein ACYSWP_06420 [Planctomycetota bacterium]|jgi:hypothetical protein